MSVRLVFIGSMCSIERNAEVMQYLMSRWETRVKKKIIFFHHIPVKYIYVYGKAEFYCFASSEFL